jgi:hypothetical protein
MFVGQCTTVLLNVDSPEDRAASRASPPTAAGRARSVDARYRYDGQLK